MEEVERVKGVDMIRFDSMFDTYIELVNISSAFSLSFSVEKGVMY